MIYLINVLSHNSISIILLCYHIVILFVCFFVYLFACLLCWLGKYDHVRSAAHVQFLTPLEEAETEVDGTSWAASAIFEIL